MNNRSKANAAKPKAVSRKTVLRAVASSTAVETRQPVDQLETKLRSGTSRFKDLPLA